MSDEIQSRLSRADASALMRYDARKKSTLLGYVLWFFLGGFGLHRFYLGSIGVGLIMLVCTLLSFVTFGITGVVTLLIWLWDLFTLPSQTLRKNLQIVEDIEAGR